MASSREFAKSAGLGTTVGILGGLLSGNGDDKLRSAGRGAVKGLGFDVGAGLGAGLGGAIGMTTLNPGLAALGILGGGVGGGVLGHSLASSAIGPYETEEEKFERMLAARESAKEKMKTAYTFGAKIAQSSCSYPSMPNAPTNKKKTTNESPAVLEAGQASEEIGKPDTTMTEHSEAKARLPEEGAKSAHEFGRKVAEFGPGVTPIVGQERAPAYGAPPYNYARSSAGLAANLPPLLPSGQNNPNRGAVIAARDAHNRTATRERNAARAAQTRAFEEARLAKTPKVAPAPETKPAVVDTAARAARERAAAAEHAWRARATRGPAKSTSAAKPFSELSPEFRAKMEAYKHGNPAPAASPTTSPTADSPGESGSGPGPAAGSGSWQDSVAGWAPYAAGGLGAAGLAALLYHLASRPKKKRREDEEE